MDDYTYDDGSSCRIIDILPQAMTIEEVYEGTEAEFIAALASNDLCTAYNASIVAEHPVLVALLNEGVVIPPFVAPCRFTPVLVRDFSVLANYVVFIDGSQVIRWDIPEMGCQDLMPSHLAQMQLNMDPPLIHGSGPSTLAVQSWRPKLNGIAAVQIVATTMAGSTVGFLWYGTTMRRVSAKVSALYEVLDAGTPRERFVLLNGEVSPDIVCETNLWRALSLAAIDQGATEDGIVILANAVEYRVKREQTFNLRFTTRDGVAVDTSNNEYYVQDIPVHVPGGIVEVYHLSRREVAFKRMRTDVVSADTPGHIVQAMRAVSLSTFKEYLPDASEPRKAVTALYRVPAVPTHVHRVRHLSNTAIAPAAWAARVQPSECSYLMSLARDLCLDRGMVSPMSLHAAVVKSGRYSSSGKLFDWFSKPPPIRGWLCDAWLVTNYPSRSTTQVSTFYLNSVEPMYRDKCRRFVVPHVSGELCVCYFTPRAIKYAFLRTLRDVALLCEPG